MNLAVASDHAGYDLKQYLVKVLRSEGHSIFDFGCFSNESADYPDFGHPLAQSIENGEHEFGISICGSGNGINMTVNKYKGIRSALCWDVPIAELARKHNDANICALPARFISNEKACEVVHTFLNTKFEGGRHKLRIDKIPIKK